MIIIPSNCASPIPSDPYWKNVSLLVKDIGINGASNNSFYDDGPYKFLPTRNGDVTQGSFSPFSGVTGAADPTNVGGSVWFDGNGDYLEFPSSTAFQFGTGDFTAEAWVYKIGTAAMNLFVWGDFSVYCGGSNELGLYVNSIGGVGMSGGTVTSGVWNHVALVRTSGVFKFYLNGISVASYSNTVNATGTYQALSFSSSTWNGAISNFRVVKGTAVYTANFTPPTAPLTAIAGTSLLTCQSATAITDASSNAFTVTKYGDARAVSDSPFGYGSVYFDGSGDILSVSDNTALNMGTGDFTWEFWFYAAVDGWSCLMEKGPSSGGTTHGIWIANGRQLFYSGGPTIYGTAGKVALNAWNHAAVTRASGVVKLWLNGSLEGSASDSTDYTTSGSALSFGGRVAGHPNGQYPLTGYVSNARIVKGSAVYTSTFTPSTAPLTAITGTSLLTCQDKGSIVDASTNSFAVTRAGDAKPVGMTPFAQKAAGYWSNYFTGGSDYLFTTNNDQTNFGTGDFTIECWFNTSAGGRQGGGGGTICGKYNYNTGGDWGFELGVALSRDVTFYNGNTQVFNSPANSFNPGVWNHLALVRASGTMTAYINGTSVYSKTVTDNLTSNGASQFAIGYANGGSATFNGYLSNLRIVKGTAVYTANFTPPAAPLTAISGTTLLTCQGNRFADSSVSNFTITRYNSVSVSRFNPFGQTMTAPTVNVAATGSVYFDGNGDYLEPAAATNASNFGTGDFTIEFWYNPAADGQHNLMELIGNSNGFTIYRNSSKYLLLWTGSANAITSTTQVVNGVWWHVALVRTSGVVKLYINGVKEGSDYSDTTNYVGAATSPRIGSSSPYAYVNGYLSNVRIVKGSAVYTGNFTPSTSPLTAISGTSLLTCQDAATITDASSNGFTITKYGDAKAVEASPFKRVSTALAGSAYFDGSGDYLSIPNNSAFRISNDFTVEFWAFPTSTAIMQPISTAYSANNAWGCVFNKNAYDNTNVAGKVVFGLTDSFGLESPAGTLVVNQWNHIAATRSGTSAKLFVNGNVVASGTSSIDPNPTGALEIGRSSSLGRDYSGYLANVRIVKGAAVYTANFTPPVSPVSAVGGTSLLLNFDNAGIYDASSNVQLTTSGNSKVSTAVKKYGTGSLALDATANTVVPIPDRPSYFAFANGQDFTVEMWVNFAYLNNNSQNMFDCRPSSTNGVYPVIYCLNQKFGFGYDFLGSNTTITGTTTPSINTWYHVAVCRSGTNIRMFVNGTQEGSTLTGNTASFLCGTNRPVLGANGFQYDNKVNGYLTDVRVTRAARYTANFTPPALEAATRMPV